MLPRIMIVEDDSIIREVYVLKFELEGYQVKGAENGAEALQLAEEFKPDIILLDMMMPVMDGLGFMTAYQKTPERGEVIVFSNVSASDQMQAVMKLGAVDYWVKSDYTPELVIDGIMKRWNGRQQPKLTA